MKKSILTPGSVLAPTLGKPWIPESVASAPVRNIAFVSKPEAVDRTVIASGLIRKNWSVILKAPNGYEKRALLSLGYRARKRPLSLKEANFAISAIKKFKGVK